MRSLLLALALLTAPALAQVPGSADGDEQFGRTLAFGDFDNDGDEDLAIGLPFETVDGASKAGAVTVVYGSATSEADFVQQWTRESEGVRGDARANDWFGFSLATGDFDGDGFADLAVGTPRAAVSGADQAGSVSVFYGSADGLTADRDEIWDQDVPGILGGAEAGDRFGWAVVAGDFDRDGFDELVVGVPNEAVGTVADAGAFQVLYGTASGLTAARNQFFEAGTSGVPGAVEAGDLLGYSLAVGDFNGDTTDDLAFGVPFEDIGSVVDAGAVAALLGRVSVGLVTEGAWSTAQDASGINDTPETRDYFGISLAVGNFNADAFDDLLVGAPYEDAGATDSGRMFELFGTPTGLTTSGARGFFNSTAGNRYGTSMAVGTSDAGALWAATSAPYTSDGSGRVFVLYTAATGDLSDTNRQSWTQNFSGSGEVAEDNDAFGFALAAGDFNGDGFDDLAFGVPGEDVGGAVDAGAVHIVLANSIGRLSVSGSLLLVEGGDLATPAETGPAAPLAGLAPPAPNPTSDRATLRFTLAAPADVRLVVTDVLGREVAVVAEGPHAIGEHTATFDASRLPSGVYVARLQAGAVVSAQRITVAR